MRLNFFIFIFVSIFFFGCAVPVLPNGKYETSLQGRDDFIAIYNNMLIMRLRNPEKISGTDDGYWDWGGKFKIRSNNRIIPDMSRSERRQWFFYYELYKNGNGIKVTDLRANNSFQLDYIPARTPPPMNSAPAADNGIAPIEIPTSEYPELK